MEPIIHSVELFVYPETPCTDTTSGTNERLAAIFPSVATSGNGAGELPGPVAETGDSSAIEDAVRHRESALAEQWALECHRAEERGYRRGMEAGAVSAREETVRTVEGELERLRAQGVALIESFDESRSSYFQKVEQETVRLALAVAARILRREAQMDPLLLTGAVRVALGQLSDTTVVRLLVPSQDEEAWKETLKLIPRLRPRPHVVGDATLELGECRIETELGTVDLGLAAQLKEIERNFLEGPGGTDNARIGIVRQPDAEFETCFMPYEEDASLRVADHRTGHDVEAIR